MADEKTETSAQAKEVNANASAPRSKNREGTAIKRKCVSTACIACRRRKSKCDGNTPSCAACASVYGTECVYDPNSDHRRKGVYKKGVDSAKTQDAALRVLIEGILNCPESEVLDLVKHIRTCESLDDVAQSILTRSSQYDDEDEDVSAILDDVPTQDAPRFETELSGKLGGIRLENGAMQFLGGTSNLLYLDDEESRELAETEDSPYASQEEAVRSWTSVTQDVSLILHLTQMYFTWHYPYFTTLSRISFFRDFLKGRPIHSSANKTVYCTPLLLNAILALGCHFTSWPRARADPEDSSTAGDQFFRECKRIIVDNDEHEHARITTVQALALMSVREAGCGREAKGWIYSGMSFRMALDLGLPYETSNATLSDEETDARRITFWGCYLFDKCWSNYLGRPPQLALDNITMKKFDVFPQEDAGVWAPWTDAGAGDANAQPARTRAVALQISTLCEISSDLLLSFYRPNQLEKPLGKQAELKKLSDLHTRLEAWRRNLPKEFEAREGQLPQVLIMHMFFYLLFIHLFRPFLKYTQANSPLPPHVSPRRHCTQAAAAISKLLRLYKRTHGLRQICNIAVYIVHSACTIHVLNLQERDSRRDLAHGLKHLEEISECWLCARRTINIIAHQIKRWGINVPDEVQETLDRAETKFQFSKIWPDGKSDGGSPGPDPVAATPHSSVPEATQSHAHTSRLETAAFNVQIPQSLHQPGSNGTAPRVRSPSSEQRAELLRQVQQNSIQAKLQQQQYANAAFSVQQPKWNEQIWKMNTEPPSIQTPIIGGSGTSQAQKRRLDSVSMNDKRVDNLISPTAMFAPQQPNNIFEEQRDWWLRDQSALFDGWMKHENASGPGPSMQGPPQVPAGANGLMGSDVYSGLADALPSNVSPTFRSAADNDLGLGQEWSSFDFPTGVRRTSQIGNGNVYKGYNTGLL